MNPPRRTAAPLILVLNAGSTARQFALFAGQARLALEELSPPEPSVEALADAARRFLADQNRSVSELSAIIARGGILRPIPGGVYAINDAMLRDCLEHRYGRHVSNLVAPAVRLLLVPAKLARRPLGRSGKDEDGAGSASPCVAGFAEQGAAPSILTLIANPPTVDELCPEARTTGIPDIKRRSIFHALNQKAVGADLARTLGKSYDQVNLIVVHMGGGLTVGAHRRGKVVDVNDGLEGDGPFSMNRTGSVPLLPFLRWAQGKSIPDLTRIVCKTGGVFAHLGTDDARVLERLVNERDPKAIAVLAAYTYHVAKAVAALAIPLEGKVDAIALTGGLARWKDLVENLKGRLSWLAPVHVYPGSREIEALAAAALAVLTGEQAVLQY
jgi:butyrate kinase